MASDTAGFCRISLMDEARELAKAVISDTPLLLRKTSPRGIVAQAVLIALAALLGNQLHFPPDIARWVQPAQCAVMLCALLYGRWAGLMAAIAAAPLQTVTVIGAIFFYADWGAFAVGHYLPGQEWKQLFNSNHYVPASGLVGSMLCYGLLTGWLVEKFRVRHFYALIFAVIAGRIVETGFPAVFTNVIDPETAQFGILTALPQVFVLAPAAKFLSDRHAEK